jgi:hypothetical protein
MEVRRWSEKQYELLTKDPAHPSLQLKPVGAFWSARVSDAYRVIHPTGKYVLVVLDWRP